MATSQVNLIAADILNISGGSFTQTNTNIIDPLNKLKYVSSAGIHALDEDGCMEGTRVSLLKDLQQWSVDATAPPIFWLDGMAGTGKSAVARSFCRCLRETHRLGGSFFCLRGHESRANAGLILPTLAWFLARQDPQYQTFLSEILRDAPDVADYPIKRQVEFLLEKPLRCVSANRQRPPLVLAIDALDECANAEEVEQLLKKLLCVCKDLPVKFFLTSRPERHIVSHFVSSQPEFHRILRLHEIEQDIVEADLLLYFTKQLGIIRSSHRSPSMFPKNWPFPRDIGILTRLSGKLFIYAITAVKYIAAKNHVKRLQSLTRLTVDAGQPFYRPLDKMYSLVLSAALDPNECTSEEICMTKRILGAIIAIREPLRLSDLVRLLAVAPDDIWENTDRIRAVVNVPPSGEDGEVSIFHASFVDFLTTSGRAPENMMIKLSAAHWDLADGCLKIMNSGLRFNIANCETSYLFNSEQMLTTIPPPLKYASFHWADHMDAANDASLLPRLEDLLFEKFLFWLEVLSVSGMGSRASPIISRALTSEAARRGMTENLLTFLHDANEFAVAFRQVIETSVPHIYLSALPSVQKSSKVAEVFLPKYPSLMRITTRGVQQQRVPLLELRGHAGNVVSVGFSPDGTHIVSGSWDKTIRIWDARTGEEVMKPLKGHTDDVSSVGFSPDGTHIISGSWDNMIRIWDAWTGQEVMKPVEGHTGAVTSVDCSPSGTHIVSGSWDKTIRIWDSKTGEEVSKPLKGHTNAITSVNFSPDGTQIVSGSWDETIRIWDARTGEEVMKPLKGHTDVVSSVAFSLDGTNIVSGSLDNTIRIWDARTGEEVMKPLKGHADMITSVGFSPDGAHIVSGSWDKTIRIWDARTGEEVMKPLKGHTMVTSVGFSPDGYNIVSGSWDEAIRLWDARTGEEIVDHFKGHTDVVSSVGFSPDGSNIVSGSWDRTIRIWDSRTGQEVTKPLEGHTDKVTSVCFSPGGTEILSGSWDETIRVWDTSTGKEITETTEAHLLGVTSVGFSPDMSHIVIGSWDKTIQLVWDTSAIEEFTEPLKGHVFGATSVAFSPDGTHIVSGSDRTIRLWDPRTGKEIIQPLKGHTDIVTAVGFSSDGTRIVSGSWDKTVSLIWDARTGEEVIQPLKGHTDAVTSVAFSSDGTRIVSGSEDKTIRIWDARIGEDVKPTSNHGVISKMTSIVPSSTFVLANFLRHSDLGFVHEDGWIRGSHRELILWVLPGHDFVQWHPCLLIIGRSGVYFDPVHYVHGSQWIRCNSNSLNNNSSPWVRIPDGCGR